MCVEIYSYNESLIEINNLVTENFQKEYLRVPFAATISTDTHSIPHLSTISYYNFNRYSLHPLFIHYQLLQFQQILTTSPIYPLSATTISTDTHSIPHLSTIMH